MRAVDRPLFLFVVAALVAACNGAAPATSPIPLVPTIPARSMTPLVPATTPNAELAISLVARKSPDPASAIDAAKEVNGFGLDLYRAFLEDPSQKNVVISPTSVAIALAMARAGARTETAAQMDTVMRGLGSDQSADGINALDQALSSRSGTFRGFDGKPYDVTLSIANAPFAQRDEQWQQPFLDALAQRFGAGLRLVDYKNDLESARQQINGWVSDETNQRIPELIGQGILDELTRLVLVNAIYLKAPWAMPFDPSFTKDGTFIRPDGSTVQVPMMAMQSEFTYAHGTGWQAVELPYAGGSLAMTIIVPDDLASFVGKLDGDAFAQITTSLSTAEVDLTLPRFSTQSKADLADLLKSMGMSDAFDPNAADFSGMTTQDQLFIAEVIHQANISVDEKGTEAAAATAVGMSAAAMPTDVVHLAVDRPFMFALRDVPTGAVLFLGQIVDPSAN